jgi:hypothetical protein
VLPDSTILRDGGILYQSHYAGLSVQRPEVDYSRVFEDICAVSASVVPIQYSFFLVSLTGILYVFKMSSGKTVTLNTGYKIP